MFKKIFSFILLSTFIIFLSNQVSAESRDESHFIGASYEAKVANCSEWISLRYAPSADSERIAKIPLGTVVTVYDGPVWGIDGFYPVEYNGLKGYCFKDYLEYYRGGGAPIR